MSERLQKYLARAGVASRRAAEGLITAGRVRINNERVTVLGTKVEPGDLVTLDGKLVAPAEERAYYILYKPTGVVTTMEDPQGRPTVASFLEGVGRRLFPVGRLDYDAEGALLCTDDGELAHQLTHPSFEVPRTYLAKVKGVPDAASLDKLRGGVRLEDGMAKPEEVEVHEAAEKNTWLRLVVTEGRPHLIKRLCAAIGHPVVRLYRPSQGGIRVKGMAPGALRALTDKEVELLWRVARGERIAEGELTLPPRRHGRSGGAEDDDAGVDFEGELETAPAPSRVQASGRGSASAPRPPRTPGARAAQTSRKPDGAGVGSASSRSVAKPPRGGDRDAKRGRTPRAGMGVASEGGEGRKTRAGAPSRSFTAERSAAARGRVNARRDPDDTGRSGRGAAGRGRDDGERTAKGRTPIGGGRGLVSRRGGDGGRAASGTAAPAGGASAGRPGFGRSGRSTEAPARNRDFGPSGRSTGATGRSTGATGRSTGATGRSTGARGVPAARRTGPAGKAPSGAGRGRSAPAADSPKAPRGKRPGSGGGRPGSGRGRSR